MSRKKRAKRGRPTIFKKPMTARERKRRSRLNIAEKQELALIEEEEAFEPEFIDTTQWTWRKWSILFLGITLTFFQIIVLRLLDSWLRIIIRIPRRHGKSTIILRIFMTRKICETRIRNKDVNFAYISSDTDNVQTVVFLVYNDLTENEKIIENYGFILGRENITAIEKLKTKLRKSVRFREYKQTQFILNSGYRKNLDNHTLFGVSIAGKLRGKGYDYVFIDDPVDTFHTDTNKSKRKLTKKIFNMVQAKIIPLAIMCVALVGTTYDQEGHDIFGLLGQEMDGKIWKELRYKAISVFGKYRIRDTIEKVGPHDIIIDNPENWELLSPFIWDQRAKRLLDMGIECTGLQLVVYLYHSLPKRFFFQEYQNESIPISDYIQYEWLQDFTTTPSGMTYGVMVDIASGETEGADYNAFTFVGFANNHFYIFDIMWGHYTPAKKQKMLEEFVVNNCDRLDINYRHISVMIETVRGQRDFFQQIRESSFLTPKPITPSRRGEKKERIKTGFGQEAENSRVHIHVNCRHKDKLREEMESFPSDDVHDDIVDSIDQNMFHLKKSGHDLPVSGETYSGL